MVLTEKEDTLTQKIDNDEETLKEIDKKRRHKGKRMIALWDMIKNQRG